MGTTVSVSCYVLDTLKGLMAIDHAFQLLDSFNLIFSDYNPDSEILQICSTYEVGESVQLSDPLFDLIGKAQEIGWLTDGSFNIAVGALTHLWRTYLADQKIPPRRLIRRFKKHLHQGNLQLIPPDKMILHKKDMRLDFGGIAKGYIGDRMAARLRDEGIHIFLIDLGGDLVAGDAPPDSEGWKITISWCDQVVQIDNRAIATSGPDFQFFIYRGRRYAHIIDPQTGWGVSNLFGTTVIAEAGFLADALASAFSILPLSRTSEILSRKTDIAAIIGINNELISSDNFSDYVVSDRR